MLEQRDEGQGHEYVERLAHHAVGGEEWDRAARYLHEAGEKALAHERYAAAVAFQEEAIRVIERLGDAADRALQLDAYLELWAARASFPGSAPGYDVLRDLGERVEALAVALGDGSRLARLRVCQAQAEALDWFEPRSLGPALAHAREADQLATPADVRTRSYARFIAGVACRDLGRYDEALDTFDSGIALLYAPHGEVGLIEPIRVSLCAWRAEALAARGDFAAAIASATQGLDVANRIGHVNSMILASGFLGYVLLVRGDVEAAIPILRRGLGVAEEHGYMGNRNTLYLGYALLLLGQRDEGLRTLERAAERLAAVRGRREWTRYGMVVSAYVIAGELAKAEEAFAEAYALVARQEARGYEPTLLRLEGELLARRGADTDLASDRYAKALSMAGELGMRPEMAHCHLGLANLYHRTGKPGEAQQHLGTAITMYREMEMRLWLERAESQDAR